MESFMYFGDSPQQMAQTLRDIVSKRENDKDELESIIQYRGYESGFAHATLAVSANYSAGIGDLYIDAVGGASGITITLDANPIDGQRHEVWKNDAGVGAVGIAGNGKNINGSSSISLSSQYDAATLVYMAAAGEWRKK